MTSSKAGVLTTALLAPDFKIPRLCPMPLIIPGGGGGGEDTRLLKERIGDNIVLSCVFEGKPVAV